MKDNGGCKKQRKLGERASEGGGVCYVSEVGLVVRFRFIDYSLLTVRWLFGRSSSPAFAQKSNLVKAA